MELSELAEQLKLEWEELQRRHGLTMPSSSRTVVLDFQKNETGGLVPQPIHSTNTPFSLQEMDVILGEFDL